MEFKKEDIMPENNVSQQSVIDSLKYLADERGKIIETLINENEKRFELIEKRIKILELSTTYPS
jgi:hypothetical protein